VFKRCNSTVAATQIRPDEWDYAKPFEDIPGPKPLPIIGNAWRFIPYIGNVFCHTLTNVWRFIPYIGQVFWSPVFKVVCERRTHIIRGR
jgi:hypothetical protein